TDEEIVERQLGRRPRAFRSVVVRCPFGRPAVTEQAPFGEDGSPFPTQYYVTCPFLVAAIARLEAAGGVERWSRASREDGELADAYVGADEWVRDLLEDAEPVDVVPVEPGTVADAAFHAYARGAMDYRP